MPPALQFSIGDDAVPAEEGTTWFQFIGGSGEIPQPQERVERLSYPGVPYSRFRLSGVGSVPFFLRTTRDVLDIDAGRALFTLYAGKVGADSQKLVWADHDYETTDNLKVVVIGVDMVALEAVNVWCNAFDPASQARLDVGWRLEFRDQ